MNFDKTLKDAKYILERRKNFLEKKLDCDQWHTTTSQRYVYEECNALSFIIDVLNDEFKSFELLSEIVGSIEDDDDERLEESISKAINFMKEFENE
jgi:hypothetical protein